MARRAFRNARQSRLSLARTTAHRGHGGFTLVEMMVAIGILLVGITALLGVLGVGLQTRRTAEQRQRANQLVGQVVQDLEERLFVALPQGGQQPLPPQLEVNEVPGQPGLRYRVQLITEESSPDLVLATIAISWLEQGEARTEEYQRILVRKEPYSTRVSRRRSKT